MPIASTNPATGEVIQTFEPLSAAQIEEKLALAVTTFQAERQTPFAERARRMQKAAETLEREKDKFAHMMTLEMGKPYKAVVEQAKQEFA
jgi:succinate-semialdehyde dehydrogenase/glutarate-semialdehyde dehydrogenase